MMGNRMMRLVDEITEKLTNILSPDEALRRIVNWDRYNYYTYCYARVGRCLSSGNINELVKLILVGKPDGIMHATLADHTGRVISKCDTLTALPSSPYREGRIRGNVVEYDGKLKLPIAYAFNVSSINDVELIYNQLTSGGIKNGSD